MQKVLVALLLVVSMACQTVAMAAPAWSFGPGDESSHGAMHDHGEDHHHHFLLPGTDDDPEDPGSHMLADHFSGPAALPAEHPAFLELISRFPGAQHSRSIPHPHLDGPLRPPRPIA
ncbi:MAG: hypothetical protein AB7P08_04990 [Burkholderiales bacterium]